MKKNFPEISKALSGKFLEKFKTLDITKISLYLLVFLLPLFWLPFSFEQYEITKFYLFLFLTSFAFLVWLVEAILKDKEVRFRLASLDIPVLLFLLSGLLSFIFSIERRYSLLGVYGRFSDSLIGLSAFCIFYFLIRNKVAFNDKNDSNNLISSTLLLKIFLFSSFFVILITYFSVFGIWEKMSGNLTFLLQRTFNPVSLSLEGLAVFVSIVMVVLVSLILCQNSEFNKAHFWILLFMALGLLIVINFSPAWIILIVGFSVFLFLSLLGRIFKKNVNRLLLPIVLIIFSSAILLINIKGNKEMGFFFPLGQEELLNKGTSWEIALNTVRKDLKDTFFGSGIGTWYQDFLRERPADFNKSILWDIRFNNAGDYISELFATLGGLGIFSYLLLIGIFFFTFFLLGIKKEIIPYVAAFSALLTGQFVYYQNTILAFSFWFILGLAVCSKDLQKRTKVIKKSIFSEDFPELSLIPSIALIILSFFIFGSYYFLARFYLADVNYAKSNMVSSIEERVGFLKKAVELNPNMAVYQTALARTYLLQILEELKKPLQEQDAFKIQSGVVQAVNQARETTEKFPKEVIAWEELGVVYREIQFLVEDANEWAIDSFQKAIAIDGKNPVLYTEIGKLYLSSGDIKKAKESFVKAEELKPDYLDALMQEALVYEIEDNLDEAIYKMEELEKLYPMNTEIKFQLGRFYFNNNDIEKAISLFETITKVNPNHSNALYSLGLAYEQKGEKEKAIFVLEKVLKLNPDNQELIEKIGELKQSEEVE